MYKRQAQFPEEARTLYRDAVSYTHLDVYKRQTQQRYLAPRQASTQHQLVAVSYTHLDVYKRQPSHRLLWEDRIGIFT